ncbi:MAG: 6-carboxytetrahydropterin synthase QueD [Candidatus Omnitrophica bacterium]|nr:6-carboxytetrahydropterin synthase QueD [Candidatus Omnitrophota bacterium]MCM8809878.1 6-carboxytetrahydropterin synthase QueD [Candidatus Omnitrophota bacterium]MCM8810462.1 6-carboxytetrahydropterin synthase QueD [Candidatus Omnitrophota bacterium]
MFELRVNGEFSSAHSLRNYKGKCENLHGHNWKVEILVSGESLDRVGLLIDFNILKNKLNIVLKMLDHKNLNLIPFFKERNPSSENIAFFIYKKMEKLLKIYPVKIKKVTVWENERQSASYYE